MTIETVKLKKTVDLAARTVTFSMGTQTRIVYLDRLAADIQTQASLHGISQKCGDEAAINRGPDGKSATADDKWQAVVAMADRLESGQWNKTGREAGEKEWRDTLAALIAYKGATGDQARSEALTSWANSKGKDAVYLIRDSQPAFLAEYVKIKSRKPVVDMVSSAALDELDAI